MSIFKHNEKIKIMKNLFFLLALTLGFSSNADAQKYPSPDKSPADIAYYQPDKKGAPVAKVIYSRPMKNDRDIFGGIIPFDKVWRTGANEAPEIKIYQDLKIANQKVKAGTYTLFTIPGEKEWTIILNSELDQWGAYNYKESADVVRIKVPVTMDKESLEAFSITFHEGNMILAWDTTRVVVPMNMK
jgi:hypothetical protein